MKKILPFSLLLFFSSATIAHGYGYRGASPSAWLLPIVAGIVGYQLGNLENKENEQKAQKPQAEQNCSPWTETQTPDGKITRTRTCKQ